MPGTTSTAVPQVSSIAQLYAQLESLRSRVIELNKQSAEAQVEVQNVAEQICREAQTLPDQDKVKLVNNLYWWNQDIKASRIARGLGLSVPEMRHMIQPCAVSACTDCGTGLFIESRTSLVLSLCEACHERRIHSINQQQEEVKQAEQRQLAYLRSLPYEIYLQTPEWKQTSLRAKRRAGFRCQLCNSAQQTLHVHHRCYDNLGAEHYTDILVLCASCHERFHFGKYYD